jgi:superfamily I DNA/RNA helicase
MQWKNFKPLISNSLSEGNDCLLVGDAKQSIYRWRNGDWEILTKRVFSEYPGELVSLEVLNTNWRSHENVVVFNNRLFKSVAELLDRQIKNIFEEAGMADGLPPEFSRIVYGDVEQMVSIGNRNKGFVNVQFVDREELKNIPELADNHLLEHINSLLSRGYDAGDIAIIVRNKRDGRDIADLIIDKNSKAYFVRPVSVISGESLFIGKSNAVNLVIAAIATLLDPTNSIMQGKLGYHLQVHRQMLAGDRETIRTVYTSLLPALRNNENHLPKDFADSGSKLISLPLYDMAESLIRIFSLGELSLEIPYLDAFLDMVHDFVKTNASDPVKFLEYWEEEGRFRSVPDNNSRDAVRIMTIHKAKGLEFKAVIVPECNWELDQKPRSVFWVKPGNKLFSYLPVLPLSYNQNLKATWFAGDYYNEYYKSNVDNVNLLYVACTRAIESLMVISPVNTQKNESRISNVGELLYAALVQQHNVNENGIFDAETLLFSYGEMNHPEGRHSRTNEMAITGMICKPVTERLFFNSYGYDFFEDTTGISGNKALKGITLHTILSKVRLAADISGAVEQAVFEGLIGDGEKADLLLHLEEGMRDMRVKRWFDGSGQIFNEAEILMPDGDTKRPDRVVIFQHSVHVIDYKFGAHSNIELHKRQVAGYMEILKLMGYENIEGYLWYLNSNRIEEI